jgi:5-methylcytosine-specific restriction enzyme B
MKPLSDGGQLVDATLHVVPTRGLLSVMFESRGGSRGEREPVNTEYKEGLLLTLQRLRDQRATIEVFLASRDTQHLSEDQRRLLNSTDLQGVEDLPAIRDQIQEAASNTGRQEGARGSGNNTKRLEIRCAFQGGMSERELEAALKGKVRTRPVMKVFYGPPGTGKTYLAAREAVRIIDGSLPDEPFIRARHDQLVREGRITWVTFHPSYSYEDFVEGFRPYETAAGQIGFKPVDGPFKLACGAREGTSPMSLFNVGEILKDGAGRDCYRVVEVHKEGVVLSSQIKREDKGTPVTEFFVDFRLPLMALEKGIELPALITAGTKKLYDMKKKYAEELKLPMGQFANLSGHGAVFRRLKEDPVEDGGRAVLVIDEINRADLSRVFGELITLLETDKRIGGSEETWVRLPYSGGHFCVPMGLSVVATMNTADRSLSVFDLALRRRFEFQAVLPEPALCPRHYGGIDIQGILSLINQRITAILSPDLTFGHAEMMEERLEAVRTQFGWSENDEGRLRAVAATLRRKLYPLLAEYFHTDEVKIGFVIGQTLMTPLGFPDLKAEELEEIGMHLEDGGWVGLGEWWDPWSPSWDAIRFKATFVNGDGGGEDFS